MMTLFSAPDDPWSHRTRIVIAEKGIEHRHRRCRARASFPRTCSISIRTTRTPTLVDRDLVLYDSRVIIEYLDERFPHPPLMPVDPVSRARSASRSTGSSATGTASPARSTRPDTKDVAQLRKVLRDNVLASADLFKLKPFFLSDEFSLVDATIAPILWRLPRYEIDLPPQAQPIVKYASIIFSRPAFRDSLSEAEREMRLA